MDRIKTVLSMLWKQEVSADPRDSSFFRALKLSEGVPCHLYSLGASEKRPFWLAYIFFHFVSMILCVGSRIDKTLKHIFLKVTFLGFCWPWDLDHSSDLEGKKRRWDEWPGWCKTNVAFGFDCRIYTVYSTIYTSIIHILHIHQYLYYLRCHVSDSTPRKTPGASALGTDFEVLGSHINTALKDEVSTCMNHTFMK